jgi:hypothetical protein
LVRAVSPVPKFNPNAKEAYIVFYFEGHIKQTSIAGILIIKKKYYDQKINVNYNYLKTF